MLMMKIFPIMYRMGVICYKQEQGQEFSGLWVGVRPDDYPDMYEQLLGYYCIKYRRPAYHGNNRTICRNCYHNINEHEQEQYTDSKSHYICANSRRFRASFCKICERRLAEMSAAGSCPECIEEYIRISIADRNLLINGGLLRVINRWSR
jgi:hypothetical protein